MQTKVAIVNARLAEEEARAEDTLGDDNSARVANSLKQSLGYLNRWNPATRCWERAANTRVVASQDEALSWVNEDGVIVFTNHDALAKAKDTAKKHPRLRVVMLTEIVPKEGLLVIGWQWFSSDSYKGGLADIIVP